MAINPDGVAGGFSPEEDARLPKTHGIPEGVICPQPCLSPEAPALPAGFKPPLIETLHSPLLERKAIRLTLVRLDTIHPEISGNKWFKLKENIRSAKTAGKRQLISFGGAHSNHLAALAVAAAASGMASIGFVRGWHGRDKPNPTLIRCREAGMFLHFQSRQDYARRESPEFLNELAIRYPEAWIIPEGGNNAEGRAGASEIATYVPADAGWLVLPVGTGTTLAGLRKALPDNQRILGMVPFKHTEEPEAWIRKMQGAPRPTRGVPDGASGTVTDNSIKVALCNKYHFGGFSKTTASLIDFMNGFYQTQGVPLDFIYTGKMMYGLMDLIEKDRFPPGSHLCALHTGGLQGNSSRNDLVY